MDVQPPNSKTTVFKASDYKIDGFVNIPDQNRLIYYSNIGLQASRITIFDVLYRNIELSIDLNSALRSMNVDSTNLRIIFSFNNGTIGYFRYMLEEKTRIRTPQISEG